MKKRPRIASAFYFLGRRTLAGLDLQAGAHIAARRAGGVRALGGAAVWAERGVLGLDCLMRATTTGTTWGAAERRDHVRFLSVMPRRDALGRSGEKGKSRKTLRPVNPTVAWIGKRQITQSAGNRLMCRSCGSPAIFSAR